MQIDNINREIVLIPTPYNLKNGTRIWYQISLIYYYILKHIYVRLKMIIFSNILTVRIYCFVTSLTALALQLRNDW